MQKTIKLRCPKNNLESLLYPYTSTGWKVISMEKGFWTRVLTTYTWTIVLEKKED